MEITRLAIPEILLLKPRKFEDDRGYFSETFNDKRITELGLPSVYVQDNQSLSRKAGTIRGIHFQTHPFAQDKLVRVLKGRILDIAVDLRRGSPTYGQHVKAELTADGMEQLFIPIGFGHAFCTLEDNCEVLYKVTNYYSPTNDAGLIWNDPDMAIDWPVRPEDAQLSDKDQKLPRFKDLPEVFTYSPADAESTKRVA